MQGEISMPPPGVAAQLAPGIVRLLAPNPSQMTHWGTNTYLVGTDPLVIIDPGPALDAHFDALMQAADGRRVSYIAVTHAHTDHSALAPRLSRASGAPIAAFGTVRAGRSAAMAALAAAGLTDGGEGIDATFVPDLLVKDGDTLGTGDAALTVLHTPGHIGGHLCFANRAGDAWFTGDHIMGWASSLISPPDGDMTDFMASCARLRAAATSGAGAFPGHGAPVPDLKERIDTIVAHRLSRETRILAALAQAPGTAADLAARIYDDIPTALRAAAARNVLAHAIDLTQKSRIHCCGPISSEAIFHAL